MAYILSAMALVCAAIALTCMVRWARADGGFDRIERVIMAACMLVVVTGCLALFGLSYALPSRAIGLAYCVQPK